MRKILCATDLSQGSDEALRQADGYCREADSELTALYVEPPLAPAMFPDYGAVPVAPVAVEDARARAREAMQKQVERVGVACPKVRLEIAPSAGAVYAEIVRRAEEGGYHLVVMGGQGATGLTRVLIGSVADKVVRYAHTPVLVARPAPARGGQVVVGSDFSPTSRVALKAGAAEATRRGASLTVVHSLGFSPEMMGFGYAPMVPAPAPMPESRVVQEQAAKQRLEKELRELGIQNASIIVEEGEPAPALSRLAESLPAQLLVVGASGKTGLTRVLLGSVAQSVVGHAPCSVLVARDPSAPATRG
jgi:nucleotide-binding universal stress UspA family protein